MELAYVSDPTELDNGYWVIIKDGQDIFSSVFQDEAQDKFDELLSEEN